MNDDYDNDQTDREALERFRPTGPTIGEDGPAITPSPLAACATPVEWRIRDLDELNRVLGRMARLERLQTENERIVVAESKRLWDWLEKENEALARRYRDLAAHVEVYARDNREALGKTRRLPNGVVAWRERKEGAYRWRQDMTPKEREAALLKWAKDMQPHVEGTPLTVPGPEKPNLEEIKALLIFMTAETGDPAQADGLEWVGPGESLSVMVGGSKK